RWGKLDRRLRQRSPTPLTEAHVATGDIAERSTGDREMLGEGEVEQGRLSIARRVEGNRPRLPFSPSELSRVDEALGIASRTTGLEFAIYLGALGEDTRRPADAIHAYLGVLVAVSPGQRQLEIVTGEEAHRRIPDRNCQLAAMSMVASFKEGELVDGLVSGLQMLADAAGTQFSGS